MHFPTLYLPVSNASCNPSKLLIGGFALQDSFRVPAALLQMPATKHVYRCANAF